MTGPRWTQTLGGELVRRGKLLLAAGLASAVLAACGGGGGGDSPAVSVPSNPPPGAATSAVPGSRAAGAGAATGSAANDTAARDSAASDSATSDGAAAADGDRSATLSWSPPTVNDDGTPLKLTGYRVYWGPLDDYYPHSVTLDNPGLSRYVVENLAPATWYFVVTALSGEAESPPSNVLKMELR